MAKPKANQPASKDKRLSPSKVATTPPMETAQNGNGHPPAASTMKLSEGAVQNLAPIRSQSGVDLTEKIKELLRLAQEQGYLTYTDINDALPENIVTADDLDEIYIKLRSLELEIVD